MLTKSFLQRHVLFPFAQTATELFKKEDAIHLTEWFLPDGSEHDFMDQSLIDRLLRGFEN